MATISILDGSWVSLFGFEAGHINLEQIQAGVLHETDSKIHPYWVSLSFGNQQRQVAILFLFHGIENNQRFGSSLAVQRLLLTNRTVRPKHLKDNAMLE
jgi:hypothetical protein